METQKETNEVTGGNVETAEAPDVIQMDPEDIRTGVQFEIEAARAQARLQAIIDSAQLYARRMREKYQVSDEYEITDWITGFQRAKE